MGGPTLESRIMSSLLGRRWSGRVTTRLMLVLPCVLANQKLLVCFHFSHLP